MQTKIESHVETAANIASGFIISWLVWHFGVGPAIAREWLSIGDSFIITCIFTVTSYIRSYVWRRYFNKRLHNALHRLS